MYNTLMPNFIDLTGQRFGRLIVLQRIGTTHYGQPIWACRCDCGNHVHPFGNALRVGLTTSCGCYRKEVITKHGLSNAGPEYAVWNTMIHRCYNPKIESYPLYGGRGITVCDRWRDSFEAFLEDMGPRPSKTHSIERRDNNGNYCPENCLWATRREQGSNKRNNHILVVHGERLTFAECMRRFNIPKNTLRRRLKLGQSPEEAVAKVDRRLAANRR